MLLRWYNVKQSLCPKPLSGICHGKQPGAKGGHRVALFGCCLLLALAAGCIRATPLSTSTDVVYNPELVKHCTLKSAGTYSAIGEKNALTLAKNNVTEKGGNVLLVTAVTKSDAFTTVVHAKTYACDRRP